jgi:hypothetical protein
MSENRLNVGSVTATTSYLYGKETARMGALPSAGFRDSHSLSQQVTRIFEVPTLRSNLQDRERELGESIARNAVVEPHCALPRAVLHQKRRTELGLIPSPGDLRHTIRKPMGRLRPTVSDPKRRAEHGHPVRTLSKLWRAAQAGS